MKHFLNKDFLAPNVMTFAVDREIVGEFEGLATDSAHFSHLRPPSNWNTDIEWVSAADEETFELFQSAFDRLGIADHARPYLDIEREVRLYAGFLVIRSRCDATHFHVDWLKTNNEAFTVMTPVGDAPEDFGLLYRKLDGTTGDYPYKQGEAIGFGENFDHSTKPGRSNQPVVLLCFEFGTDRMEHWPMIKRTIGTQTTHLRRPDGSFTRASGRVAETWTPPQAPTRVSP